MNLYSPLIAAFVTLLLTRFLLFNSAAQRVQDVPNERSLHSTSVPRVGGIGLMAGILSGWLLMFNSLTWWLALPLLGLFVVSLLDDIHTLSVTQRLLAHLIASATVVAGSGVLAQHGWVLAIVVLLLIVWMTNLYNFMDGSDGLAGGMALFGFGAYGVAGWLENLPEFAFLNFSIASAALAFLFFNFHPAKLFMGDAGSIPLGFLAAVMGVWGMQLQVWPYWFPLLVFAPFVVDATVTLVKRTAHGEKIWLAHRDHYYQRAIQLGWGHRNTALFEYLLMISAAGSGLLALRQPSLALWMLLACGCVMVAAILYVERSWKRRQHV